MTGKGSTQGISSTPGSSGSSAKRNELSVKAVRSPKSSKTVLEWNSGNRRKEKPLNEYVLGSYMAVLEGALLSNGDLKGSWRYRREDPESNKFCMVLMDRGVYNGGYNISTNDPSRPSILEVHDKWHALDWCETTKTSTTNIWGRGRSLHFGECCLLGTHDPRQKRITLYKVREDEMEKAKYYANNYRMAVTSALASCSSSMRQSSGVSSAEGGGSAINTTKNTTGQKRPRTSSASGGEIVAAATALVQTTCRKPGFVRAVSSGDVDGRNMAVGRVPVGLRITTSGPMSSKTGKGKYRVATAAAHTLPGFSALDGLSTDDDDNGDSTEVEDTEDGCRSSVADITDLTTAAARLQREKTVISQRGEARRNELEQKKARLERTIKSEKMEEKIMLKAVQDLRRKTMEDEMALEKVQVELQTAQAEDRKELEEWSRQWDAQVAPFIAQHEQGMKKKAEEAERKARAAEREKMALEQELAKLHSMKNMMSLNADSNNVNVSD